MDNIFVTCIHQGRIRSLEDLKRTYRRIVMKTHPDAVGSDRLVEQYIECRNHYEEARALLEGRQNRPSGPSPRRRQEPPPEQARREPESAAADYRLLFYREFYRLERIDKPYAFNKYYVQSGEIDSARRRAFEYFGKWQKDPQRIRLYEEANRIYDQIKQEKPRGPQRRYALLFHLSPVLHNILSYQLTGQPFYRKQLEQNHEAVLSALEQRQFHRLVEFLRLLIADVERGPAIHETG